MANAGEHTFEAGDIIFREGESGEVMAAALLEVGRGRLKPEAIARALESKDRASIPGALGPYGLCLVVVLF